MTMGVTRDLDKVGLGISKVDEVIGIEEVCIARVGSAEGVMVTGSRELIGEEVAGDKRVEKGAPWTKKLPQKININASRIGITNRTFQIVFLPASGICRKPRGRALFGAWRKTGHAS